MFRNTLTANDKYPFRDLQNLLCPTQLILPLKPITFSVFSIHFWNLHQVLNILKKKMTLIATLLRKLPTVKDLVRRLYKKQRFRTPFDSQHDKGSRTLGKSA